MNSQNFSILLILQPEEKLKTRLHDFIVEKGFKVFNAQSVKDGIFKARDFNPDLIICQNDMNEKNGLQIYNILHRNLIANGTSFFLLMKEYRKEDVWIGLEMGVDNFIFMPFEESALSRKIEIQFGKMKKFRILDSEVFHNHFQSTPVAKFLADGNRIVMINKALENLTGIKYKEDKSYRIDEIFDFSEKENSLINFRKCINGLKDYCMFHSVLLKNTKHQRFDIHIAFSDYFEEDLFMAEVVPTNGINKNGAPINANDEKGFHIDLDGNRFKLSPREQEVLEWSAQGLPMKQIASIMRISERTVEKHRGSIMAKTKTASMVEAMYVIRSK